MGVRLDWLMTAKSLMILTVLCSGRKLGGAVDSLIYGSEESLIIFQTANH